MRESNPEPPDANRPSRRSRHKFCVLQILLLRKILTYQCRYRKDLDPEPRICILHFTRLRLKVLFPIESTVAFHYFLLSL